jgi:hypothetical protein
MVRICAHGAADCAPLTRGDFAAVVVLPLMVPLLAVLVHVMQKYKAGEPHVGRGVDARRLRASRTSSWARNRQSSVALRKQGGAVGGDPARGVRQTQSRRAPPHVRSRQSAGLARSDRDRNPVVQQTFANPGAGGTMHMNQNGSLRLRPPPLSAGDDDSVRSIELAVTEDDDAVDDRYTTCAVRVTGEWACPRCTFAENNRVAPVCGMCGLHKPPVEEVFVPPELSGEEDEGKEGGRSIEGRPSPGFYRGDTTESAMSADDDLVSLPLHSIELSRVNQTTI